MSRKADVEALVARYLEIETPDEGLPLAVSPIGAEEIAAGIETLLSGWLTMGQKVSAFESAWAEAIGTRHAVCVNSGSSALLVMLTALVETGVLHRGDEVIVPAVGWSTSLFTVAQAGLVPVLVDVGEESLCLEGEWDRPVMAVHLLGCPSRATGPVIIEDACGAHGARIGDARVGSIGAAGAFSFFFSHHLSTIEGGMINTDSDEIANAARSVRAHGWVRERADRDSIIAANPEIDPRFLFVSAGYNLRPTEITGAMGVVQVPRLDGYVSQRRANHDAWCAAVSGLGLPLRVFPELPGTAHAAFAFPMVLSEDAPIDREKLFERLESKSVSTRPISGSNLARQPAFPRVPGARVEGSTPVADEVHERGFFVGQSHAFDETHLDRLIDALVFAFR
jgi:CDP-6-deoxy-D-xylo-4-hexulose-3-dehydrase